MHYESPQMDVIKFNEDEVPYTDLIDTSGSGNDYEYGQNTRSLQFGE